MPPTAEEILEDFFSLDITESDLKHAYDPAKAREYYLRTRELKGRRKSAVELTTSMKTKTVTESSPSAKAKALATKKAKRLRGIAEDRVGALETRFEKLNKVLAELVKQAKARSGIDDNNDSKSSSSKSSGSDQKDRKPLTASQKRDAAKKAKEAREKDGDPSLAAQAKALEAKIENVRERIAKIKAEIAESDKKSKAKTASKGR